MKSVITTLVIAIVLIGGSLMYTSHLSKQSERLVGLTNEIEQLLHDESYSEATKSIRELSKKVTKFEKFFLATGDHLEMDNIKINIAELKSYSEHEMQSDALSKTYVLKFLFEHLPHNSRLRIGNIL